ncbi:MAG: DUF1631 family protein [Burkholderiales bacterium]|nr:DUF1631 family protein [Burkholderiales bacterium]
MQLIKRVTQTAKDHAQIKFVALIRTMASEAEASILNALADPKSGVNSKVANGAIVFLRTEGTAFLYKMETLFRESVERAVRTMYNDMRQGMISSVSADRLSLVDDETVIKQMEVGHLVQRLRDACDENLGRLNMMIAQVHGDPDVNERENPFRPYLIARPLYEALRERVTDEEVSKLLFNQLADSLAKHISGFYASICDVFDASGIQVRLAARPTAMKKHQRDFLARQLAEINSNNSGKGGGNAMGGMPMMQSMEFNERVMPSLQRMQDLLRGGAGGGSGGSGSGGGVSGGAGGGGHPDGGHAGGESAHAEEFQDYVWNLFNQSPLAPGGFGLAQDSADEQRASNSPFAPASANLLSQLDRFQQLAASGQSISDDVDADKNQLFAVGDKLATEKASTSERIAIDVIAVLFEFILEDEQIPADMRLVIGRLQIPFLKAAMLWPDMLRETDHPARKLLNRMGSAAIGLDSSTPMGGELSAEIARLVKKVLQGFEKDVAIFEECLKELEAFLGAQLRRTDAGSALSIEAVEEAERAGVMLVNTVNLIREILADLELDPRVTGFVIEIWARVMVRALLQDAKNESSAPQLAPQYRDVLPELVWSALEKQTQADRNALIRLLPSLVKRLRIGMLMIHLSEDECKQALDRLVELHTQVLRANQVASDKQVPPLDELRQKFARLVINEDESEWTVAEAPPIEEEIVETLLADKGTEADLELDASPSASQPSDNESLKLIQLGTCVQCWAADTHVMARTIWISKHHSLFIFKIDQAAKPLVYSAASLIKALRDGTIRLVEYAPTFDRAVDTLMMGAEQVARH